MFRHIISAGFAAVFLTGCGGGNPFITPPPGGSPHVPSRGVTGLPGTLDATAASNITRREDSQGGQTGDGFLSDVAYNATADTFTVDGLAFDGGNVYSLDSNISLGSRIRAYASEASYTDPLNNQPIPQLTHRALYGSNSADTMRFAIVRTGSYANFGFGGFLYERDGGFSLPAADGAGLRGQGSYSGTYAGLRDFSGGTAGPELEYTSANMTAAIDYDDFNDGGALLIAMTDRRVYSMDGTDITASIAALLPGAPTELPVLSNPSLGPGTFSASGEFTGTLSGNAGPSGTYYAVIGGANASDIVGIVTFNPVADTRAHGGEVRETGGFLLTRN